MIAQRDHAAARSELARWPQHLFREGRLLRRYGSRPTEAGDIRLMLDARKSAKVSANSSSGALSWGWAYV
jgi:hypothetical protein